MVDTQAATKNSDLYSVRLVMQCTEAAHDGKAEAI